ncbi:hypothetical protein [Alkalihalobacterium elongatum]|uniref:hypothetical protein n=1 Tax=Alkalihalobacterium elongatum TaxID=2675466 RepID=UPI001C1F3F3D|nr:hypothetical protein [Alkalihalobacterium elongatum]
MINGFALEIKTNHGIADIKTLENCYYQIYHNEPIDEAGYMFVFDNQHALNSLVDGLTGYNLIEEVHELLLLDELITFEKFSDYGWKGKFYYLYRDIVLPFKISAGDEIQIKMARLQIEENLIAYNVEKQLFFVDAQFKELIEGYANAYEIHVEFI